MIWGIVIQDIFSIDNWIPAVVIFTVISHVAKTNSILDTQKTVTQEGLHSNPDGAISI